MEPYRLHFKPSVEKDLRRLPTAALARMTGAIQTLADAPLPRQSRKISGADRLYRLRIGDYRVIYEVDSVERVPCPRALAYGPRNRLHQRGWRCVGIRAQTG